MKRRNLPQDEIDDLRTLIAEERRRAKQDLIDAPRADPEAYREAFKRFLGLLPGGSPLMVTRSIPKRRQH